MSRFAIPIGRLTAVVAVGFACGSTAQERAPAELAPQITAAIEAGRFRDAEKLLGAALGDPDAPATSPAAIALENLRRVRLDYALTPDAMLDKLRRSIPDATADDLERWRKSGTLQYRMLDGEVRYFSREPSNLFRFCDEAAKRRTAEVKPAGDEFDLPQHLARLVKLAETSPGPEVYPVRHEVTYRVKVRDGHPRLKAGAKVRCWLPFPQEYRQQQDVRLETSSGSDIGVTIAPNGTPQRTLYFERTIGDSAGPVEFTATYRFVTSAYCPKLDPTEAEDYDTSGELYREFTAERPPHVVFTPEVKQIVAEACGEERNPLERARRIFRWVDANVRYAAEMEYSTIPNISAKALATRRGDCGVQALAFITLCRAAGVPARWQSGWESLPNGWNMHDWAEFYVAPWGWLPADPSYGLQRHADPRVREFYCGGLDPYRMIVNLDYARDLVPPKVSYRSEPNDFQRGEVEIDGHNLYFDEWDWTFDVRTMPLAGDVEAAGEALDAIVPRLLREGHVPGAVVAVGRRHGEGFETWQKAYGYLQTQPERVAMPSDAIFDMASLTKPVATGTCLMILADRGKLAVDDPVGKYLPEFASGDKAGVTIRRLMTHTSGLKAYLSAEERDAIRKAHSADCTAATRQAIRELPLSHPPGEAVVYSCLNAILCAEIVEKVSGQPLDAFAWENVFKPLGMNDTGFHPGGDKCSRVAPTTKGDSGPDYLQGAVHDPIARLQAGVSGNAGLFSTAGDLARFAQMMLGGGELHGVRILREETVKRLTSVQNSGAKNAKGAPDRRGLLWDIYQPDPGDVGADQLYAYGHTGYTGTALRIYPEQGAYVIVLTNRVHPDDSGKVDALRRETWRTVGEALAGAEPRPAAESGFPQSEPRP